MKAPAFILIFGVFAASQLHAQIGSWSQVQQLRPGTRMTVTTWHRAPCVLQQADDDGLECVFRGNVYWVDRARILRISVPNRGKRAALETAVGAFTGAAIEATLDSPSDSARVPRLLVGAALGGCVGFVWGHARTQGELVVYEAALSSP